MKILTISSRFHPPHPWLRNQSHAELMVKFHAIGGMQLQVYLLTKALSELGVQQEVITVKPPWSQSLEEWDNVRVYRFGLPIATRRQLYEIPALVKAFQRASHGFDLVHCHSGEDIAVIPIGLVAAKRAGIPLVLTIHNSWNFTYSTKNDLHIRQTIGKRIELMGFRQASAICTLTNRTAKLLSEKAGIDPRKIFVTPAGIDFTKFRFKKNIREIQAFAKHYSIPESRRYIVYLGRLRSQKGVIYLLKAAALLRERGEDFVIIVCGDGPERPRLEAEIRRLNLQKVVLFTRFIPHNDIPILLSMAHIFVLPSIYEEFGSVLLEAMAMQLPIVASHTGGILEIIRHRENGLLVRPMDSESLVNAISLLLHDLNLAYKLGKQAYLDAQKYDIVKIAEKIRDEIYTL